MVDVEQLYDELMFTGAQTLEKHIRHAAEKLVQERVGGFYGATGGSIAQFLEHAAEGDIVWVPFRVKGSRYIDARVCIPAGMHGFALQMVIEAQLREQLA